MSSVDQQRGLVRASANRRFKGTLAVRNFSVLVVLLSITAVALFTLGSDEVSAAQPEIYMTDQPGDQYIDDRSNAVFTVSAVSENSYELSYNWQYSENGFTWIDVDLGVGMDEYMLVISPSDYPGYDTKTYRFRCEISDSTGTVASQSGILYVGYTVHYVNDYEDLSHIGKGQYYKNGADQGSWDMDHVYIQNSDINMSGKAHIPIGDSTVPFKGTYDGNGFAIKNFSINSNATYVGVFGYTDGAILKDVSTMYGTVKGSSGSSYVGALVGYAKNTPISGCYNSVSVTGESTLTIYVGGIAGFMSDKSIIYSHNISNISAKAPYTYVGGLVGESYGASYCYNYGFIMSNGTNSCAGGITGKTTRLTYCFNNGNITATSAQEIGSFVGGICGRTSYQVDNCYNTGIITGPEKRGGIAKFAAYGAKYCYSTGATNGGYGLTATGGPTKQSVYAGPGAGTGPGSPMSVLKDKNTYTTNGWTWDFTFVWDINANVNDGIPYFRLFYEGGYVTHPADIIRGKGMTAVFSVDAGVKCTFFQWQISKDGGNSWDDIAGAETASYRTGVLGEYNNGHMYRCVSTTTYGNTITSHPATLSIVPEQYEIVTDVDMVDTGPGTGGFVYEGGTLDVVGGEDKSFVFTPRKGFVLVDVLVDGSSDAEAVKDSSFKFENVRADHTLVAVFARLVTIEATSDTGGSIDPEGTIPVVQGDSKGFDFITDMGYEVSKVLVDGVNDASAVSNGYYIFENVNADHTIHVEFKPIEYEVVLQSSPDNAGSLEYKMDGGAWLEYTAPLTVTISTSLYARTEPTGQYSFIGWSDGETGKERSIPTSVSGTYTANFKLNAPNIPKDKEYTITSSADPGVSMTPLGKITVKQGGSKTFYFSAIEGYVISDVLVDGRSISAAEVSKGYYTFTNVTSNHTIEAKNTKEVLILEVAVVGGGYVEYSINGSGFTKYSDPVTITVKGSEIELKAYADDGYAFSKWSGYITDTNSEIVLSDVRTSVYIQANFENEVAGGQPSSWGDHKGPLLLLLILVIFFLLLFLFGRSYRVTRVPEEDIIGKDRAVRKRPYRFTVSGGSEVRYRIGDGEWISIVPDAEGNYAIPKEEVIAKITIEMI